MDALSRLGRVHTLLEFCRDVCGATEILRGSDEAAKTGRGRLRGPAVAILAASFLVSLVASLVCSVLVEALVEALFEALVEVLFEALVELLAAVSLASAARASPRWYSCRSRRNSAGSMGGVGVCGVGVGR